MAHPVTLGRSVTKLCSRSSSKSSSSNAANSDTLIPVPSRTWTASSGHPAGTVEKMALIWAAQ
jgi:hypothetical protein